MTREGFMPGPSILIAEADPTASGIAAPRLDGSGAAAAEAGSALAPRRKAEVTLLRPAPAARRSSLPVSVLVADDDPIMRELLAAQIQALGYDVRTAEDGVAAAAAAELSWPDVL